MPLPLFLGQRIYCIFSSNLRITCVMLNGIASSNWQPFIAIRSTFISGRNVKLQLTDFSGTFALFLLFIYSFILFYFIFYYYLLFFILSSVSMFCFISIPCLPSHPSSDPRQDQRRKHGSYIKMGDMESRQ